MKRALVALAAALALAGGARADVFSARPGAPLGLPSADAPNLPGSLFLPGGVWAAPAGAPRVLGYEQLQSLWARAGEAYGIPWQVLAAINKVESNFGRNMGPSSAGAVGWMQFMPDTWLRWGLDANGDGVADPWDPEDAVFAAARYLAAAGGREDLSRGLFAYNRAQWYVDEVLQLAALYGTDGPDVAVALDRMQVSLEQAEAQVARASEALAGAQDRLRPYEQAAAGLKARLDDPTLLLSDRLDLEKDWFQADDRRLAAAAEVDRLRAELQAAEAELATARESARAASFSPGAAPLLGAPRYQASYVFPVGGGPTVVSVGRGHHDYPAADIAAPTGTPVYALADGVVDDAWPEGNGDCGIGFRIRTGDGLAWVYCHLSYLDRSVARGAALAGGAWVGLVGSTGNSTGPHLHLAREPADAYPQQLAWFQGFAGVAFRWQDEPVSDAAAARGPVFAVAPPDAPQPEKVVAFTR